MKAYLAVMALLASTEAIQLTQKSSTDPWNHDGPVSGTVTKRQQHDWGYKLPSGNGYPCN